jgi:hypothetical protein
VQAAGHFSLFGRQVFAGDSARPPGFESSHFHPREIPGGLGALLITSAGNFCFVLPPCSAKVTVVSTSKRKVQKKNGLLRILLQSNASLPGFGFGFDSHRRSTFLFANPKNSQFARLIQAYLANQALQEIIRSPF